LKEEWVDSLSDRRETRYRLTRQATIVGAVVNVLLTLVKIFFGIIGQSQSLLADGVHSLSDLLSDALVLFAARHAKNDPDEEHPYGHGRYETAATMGLGAFLILVGLGIVWDAGERLFRPEALLHPHTVTLFVALFSILVKEALYHYTQYLARRIKSELLRANAWHHRTDSVSSIVVMVGIGGTMAGLPYLDAIAAVLVGVMIVHIGWTLGWSAMQELVDVGLEEEKVQEIREIISSVSGVSNVHMLRTRKMGGHASADVHVQVDPWLSVSEGHRISEVVQMRLIDEVDLLSDVTVHVDPEDDEEGPSCARLPLRSQAMSQLSNYWSHIACFKRRKRIIMHYLGGRIDVDLYLPLDCFESREHAAELHAAYQRGIETSDIFRTVRIWYG
jgi:cation diffusion facilitator family transporter